MKFGLDSRVVRALASEAGEWSSNLTTFHFLQRQLFVGILEDIFIVLVLFLQTILLFWYCKGGLPF